MRLVHMPGYSSVRVVMAGTKQRCGGKTFCRCSSTRPDGCCVCGVLICRADLLSKLVPPSNVKSLSDDSGLGVHFFLAKKAQAMKKNIALILLTRDFRKSRIIVEALESLFRSGAGVDE